MAVADGVSEICWYQRVQEARDRLILNLAVDERVERPVIDNICGRLNEAIDNRLILDVKYVDRIPHRMAGKHHFVVFLSDTVMD